MSRNAAGCVLALLGAVLVFSGCRGGADVLYQDAQRALAADEFERAAHLYQEITIQAPESPLAPEAHFELAQIYYFRLRDAEAARERLVQILQDYPDAPVVARAESLLARLYDDVFLDREKALKHYRGLLGRDIDVDERRETLLRIGHCHYDRNELDLAARAYESAIALPYDADTDQAYLRLASLEWMEGLHQRSLDLLEELRQRTSDPDRRHEALVAQVEVLMSLGRFDEARQKLQEVAARPEERAELERLRVRLRAAEAAHASLDGAGEEAMLRELQKKIRWGAGRRRARRQK